MFCLLFQRFGNRDKVCCGGIPQEKNAGKKCCNVRGEATWYDQWEEVCLSTGVRRKKSRTEEQCGSRDTFDPAEQPKAECCRGRKFDTVCTFGYCYFDFLSASLADQQNEIGYDIYII